MYYNRLLNKLVIDSIDYFFISYLIASILTYCLKNYYLSEEASMAKLKADIIDKSKLIKGSSRIPSKKLSLRKSRLNNMPKIDIQNIRGGRQDPVADELAKKIEYFVLELMSILKEKEITSKKGRTIKSMVFRALFFHTRLFLETFFTLWNIKFEYLLIDSIPNPKVIFISIFLGTTTGVTTAWISAAATAIGLPLASMMLLGRSSFQQYEYNREYDKFKSTVNRLLKDKAFKKDIESFWMDIQKNTADLNKIKLQDLNWNQNPAIKEAAERLGIFENMPSANRPLNLDTRSLDPELKKSLEELGIIEKVQLQSSKTKIRGKSAYFRDLVEKRNVDLDNKLDLENIIDAEIIKEPIRIRIKED